MVGSTWSTVAIWCLSICFLRIEARPESATIPEASILMAPAALPKPEIRQEQATLPEDQEPNVVGEPDIPATPVNSSNSNSNCSQSTEQLGPVLDPQPPVLVTQLVTTAQAPVAAETTQEHNTPRKLPTAGGCGRSYAPLSKKAHHRIVGGGAANMHSIPFIAALREDGEHVCGGSLIRVNHKDESDIVVTAAHCIIKGKLRHAYTVRAGSHFLKERVPGEVEVPVIKLVRHKRFDRPSESMQIWLHCGATDSALNLAGQGYWWTANDIALVKLAWPIKFNQTIQPVCLPRQGKRIKNNVHGIVAGWGSRKENGPLSNALRHATLKAISHRRCRKKYGRYLLKRAMLCVGYPRGGRDACNGDSGGPFFVETPSGYTLHGLASFAFGCARRSVPAVYTRVSSYVKWIKKQARSLSSVKN